MPIIGRYVAQILFWLSHIRAFPLLRLFTIVQVLIYASFVVCIGVFFTCGLGSEGSLNLSFLPIHNTIVFYFLFLFLVICLAHVFLLQLFLPACFRVAAYLTEFLLFWQILIFWIHLICVFFWRVTTMV